MEYKFNIGDRVKIIQGGCGCHPNTKGFIVTISGVGIYPFTKAPGYSIKETLLETNCKGNPNGMIDERSFEMYQPIVDIPLIHN